MITIQIKSQQYQIPTKWNEVTVGQYLAITNNAENLNGVVLLSIFTGIDYDTLTNFPCDEFDIKVVPEMEWMGEPFNPKNFLRPSEITIGSTTIKTIKDAGKERFGQKLFMQQLVAKAIEINANHVSLIAPVLANYYAPYLHKDNKWVEEHLSEVEMLVLQMPIVVAYPEADFFLSGYLKYKPKKAMS